MLSNKFGEAGQNFSTPDASIEQSQMTNIRAQKARSAPGKNSGAEIMGYPRLPKARDVVQLTFNRKKSSIEDVLRRDPRPAPCQLAGRQRGIVEHLSDRIDVKFGRHITNRKERVEERMLNWIGAVIAQHLSKKLATAPKVT